MNALIWRLHRRQVIFAAAALAVLAAALLIAGNRMWAGYTTALADCAAACSSLPNLLFQGDGLIIDIADLTIVAPLLLALFWGVPLVAREIEEGTHVVAWSQSVRRRRWLGVNLGWLLLAAALTGGVLSAVVSWWSRPETALHGGSFGYDFDLVGVVPVAYAIFGVALGLTAGAVLRRVMAALAVTLAVMVGVRGAIVLWLRPHYLTPVRHLFPLINNVSGVPAGSWVLSRHVVNRTGQVFTGDQMSAIPAVCHPAVFTGRLVSCLASQGFHRLVSYQPAGRFWTFQWIESGIFLVLAAGCICLAYVRLVYRDA